MRKRHYRRNRRHHRHNPGFKATLKKTTAVFDVKLMKDVGVLLGASMANGYVTNQVAKIIPVNFLKNPPGKYVVGLLSAGALYAVASRVIKPYASMVLFGGVLDVVKRAVDQYLLSKLPAPSKMGEMLGDFMGLSDYATVSAAQLPMLHPLGDYLMPASVSSARALNGMGCGEGAVGEELACV